MTRRLIQLGWSAFAWVVSRPAVAEWLIRRAQRTPYFHLPGYMDRFWLFNAYEKRAGIEVTPIRWLPSVRIHHIKRPDLDLHPHDHPWDARTVILKGWYIERRWHPEGSEWRQRLAGYTGPIRFGDFHAITAVPPEGVWTLFITFGYRGTWGFLVDGAKVPWREYKAMHPDGPWEQQQQREEQTDDA